MSYTINSMAESLNLTPFYIRKCVRENKIQTTLVNVGNTNVKRHEISEDEYNKFKNRERRGFGKREDGRNKFTSYLTPQELQVVLELLEDLDEPCIPTRSNPSKNSE